MINNRKEIKNKYPYIIFYLFLIQKYDVCSKTSNIRQSRDQSLDGLSKKTVKREMHFLNKHTHHLLFFQ